jgi:hypothetical protein
MLSAWPSSRSQAGLRDTGTQMRAVRMDIARLGRRARPIVDTRIVADCEVVHRSHNLSDAYLRSPSVSVTIVQLPPARGSCMPGTANPKLRRRAGRLRAALRRPGYCDAADDRMTRGHSLRPSSSLGAHKLLVRPGCMRSAPSHGFAVPSTQAPRTLRPAAGYQCLAVPFLRKGGRRRRRAGCAITSRLSCQRRTHAGARVSRR